MKTSKQRRKTRGPAPARVRIKGDWADAVKKALADYIEEFAQ